MAVMDWNPRGVFGHSSLHTVACARCGLTGPGAGSFDWLGRYLCSDCQDREAAAREDRRLAALAAEVSERAAMWCLPPLDGA